MSLFDPLSYVILLTTGPLSAFRSESQINATKISGV